MVLKTGTKTKKPTPAKRIIRPSFFSSIVHSEAGIGFIFFPLNVRATINAGITHTTILGNINCFIILSAVICPPIQSIVVVTSPNGDHAPPALAAITIIPANHRRSSFSVKIFEHNEVITIAVVKLSSNAERKKVNTVIISNNFCLLVVDIF